jgi:hypothetical protein
MANMNGQYQLTNVEAQRICAVLDELMVELRLAFCVTPQTLANTHDIARYMIRMYAFKYSHVCVHHSSWADTGVSQLGGAGE